LRGDIEKARAYRETSYNMMVDFSGTPELWARNQHF